MQRYKTTKQREQVNSLLSFFVAADLPSPDNYAYTDPSLFMLMRPPSKSLFLSSFVIGIRKREEEERVETLKGRRRREQEKEGRIGGNMILTR